MKSCAALLSFSAFFLLFFCISRFGVFQSLERDRRLDAIQNRSLYVFAVIEPYQAIHVAIGLSELLLLDRTMQPPYFLAPTRVLNGHLVLLSLA